MLMRGGTSKGAYFLAEDLPIDVTKRDDLLLRIMGSPDPRQIDGIGGAHPLMSKVAIVSRSQSPDNDIDFLFAQVSVQEAFVDTKLNCGNILAGVALFAIKRGLIEVRSPETRVHVKTLNTGTRAELIVNTPQGSVDYEGDEAIDEVPGTTAAIPINVLDTARSVCGALFPTGRRSDTVNGAEVTCIDNGMPIVIIRAGDMGLSGRESCSEIQASGEALEKIEAIRLQAGLRMGLGNVTNAVVYILEDDRFWVKVSGADRLTAKCADLRPASNTILQILQSAPDRCVWGLDWPHVNLSRRRSDLELANTLLEAADGGTVLEQVMIHNPARLYGFSSEVA